MILITGAEGFIGSHLVKRLMGKYTVLAAVKNEEIREQYQRQYKDAGGLDFIALDIRKITAIRIRAKTTHLSISTNPGVLPFKISCVLCSGISPNWNSRELSVARNRFINHLAT